MAAAYDQLRTMIAAISTFDFQAVNRRRHHLPLLVTLSDDWDFFFAVDGEFAGPIKILQEAKNKLAGQAWWTTDRGTD
jgi:hypothetical protein